MARKRNTRTWKRGIYVVENRDKYIGSTDPEYRSSWEQRFCFGCDKSSNVVRWGFEVLCIPYFFPIDGKNHIYITDVYMEFISREGKLEKYVIEIKPKAQTLPPKPPKKKTKKSWMNYQNSLVMYERNIAKWKAAESFCEKRGLKFKKITEEDLFNLK